MRDQRLGGMWETLVMGSILSGQAMLTYREEIYTVGVGVIREVRRRSGGFVYLWYPQGAAYVSPFGAFTCRFHGAAFLRTQEALWVEAEHARPAQPVSYRHFDYAVAGLWGRGGLSDTFTDSTNIQQLLC